MSTPGLESLAAAKATLRAELLRQRGARSDQQRRSEDAARTRLLLARIVAESPRVVAAYLSFGSEPDTRALLGHLHRTDVTVLLPILRATPDGRAREHPAWGTYASDAALHQGRGSIQEPTGPVREAEALAEADLVICPGLAGTARGDRLGRGGGWYDRALRYVAPGVPVWLLLNDDEVLPDLPTARWDRPVTALVTPARVLDRPS